MYYYDIYLCFNDEFTLFYNWDKDIIERYLKLEVIRVADIRLFIENILSIDTHDGIFLFSDTLNAIAVDIKNKEIVAISSLRIEDEDEVCKLARDLEIREYTIKIKEKRHINYSLNEELLPKKVFKSDIINGSSSYIKYLYYCIFNKNGNNIAKMRDQLLNDIDVNFNDLYLNLYKIIYK